jgi:hypothetical protein
MPVTIYTDEALEVISTGVVRPEMFRNPLNLTAVTAMHRHVVPGWRYYREQKAIVFDTDEIREPIGCTNIAAGGSRVALNCVRYDLRVGTTTVATAAVAAGAMDITLFGNWGTLEDGAIRVDLWGIMADGTSALLMACGAYLNRKGLAKYAPIVWSQSSTHNYSHGNPSNDVVGIPKAQAIPVARPLPPKLSFTPFSTAVLPTKIIRRAVMQGPFANDPDTHYPLVMKSGITVMDNAQKYAQNGMFELHPRWSIIEGPRGKAQLPYPLGLENAERNGKTYVVGNNYFAVVDSTGETKVLAFYSHKEGVYWQEPPTSVTDGRYVSHGTFDPAIPLESRVLNEPWGLGWVPRSLEVDLNAPLVGGEPPHKSYIAADGRLVNGPLALIGDRNGGVWGVQFNGSDRAQPPYIYWFLPPGTVREGWDLVTDWDYLWISDRLGQRIAEYNTDTRKFIRNVVEAPLAASEGYIANAPQRKFYPFSGKTPLTARTHAICYPEGIDKFRDPTTGKLWLYVASTATQAPNRYCPETGEIEKTLCLPTYNSGGVGFYHSQISVSDGTVGPPGTIFHSTYLTTGFGMPQAFLPGGAGWGWFNYQFGSSNYSIAVSANRGRITTCDNAGNIDQHHLIGPDDPVINWAAAQRGFTEYVRRGYPVLFTPNCGSTGNIPLPLGETPDMDAYLKGVLRL